MFDLWAGIQFGEQVFFAQPDALKVIAQKQDSLDWGVQYCSWRATFLQSLDPIRLP